MTYTKKIATGVGAGLLAAGAAGLGYYFYASADAKKNRRIAAKWASELKNDVVAHARKLGKIDRSAIVKIVDALTSVYETARTVDRSDIERAASELKAHWQEIAKEVGIGSATPRSKTRRPAKSRSRSSRTR